MVPFSTTPIKTVLLQLRHPLPWFFCHARPNLLTEGADLFVQEGEAGYTAAIAHNWNLRSPLYS